jgi:CSLREA domain-containing protein
MRRTATLLFVFAASLAQRAPAATPTYVVNTTADEDDANPGDGLCQSSQGHCSLRAAVQEANLLVGVPIIALPATSPGNPILVDVYISIHKSMTIEGAGTRATVVKAAGFVASSVFYVDGGDVVLRAMTIANGKEADASSAGGCIASFLCAEGHQLTLEDVLLTDCTAGLYGGAIAALGHLTLRNTTVANGKLTNAMGFGGGIDFGGGSCASPQLAFVLSSTVEGSSTPGTGGGIAIHTGSMVVVNSTVGGNHAGGTGGGIEVLGGQLTLESTTVAHNGTSTSGGGGGLHNGGGSAAFTNTILANNTAPFGQVAVESDCAGALSSNGYNIVGPDGALSCSLTGSGVTYADPALGPLQDNGGATPTYALFAGSPAIGSGDPSGCQSMFVTITTDQRGVKRPIGTRCDVGAYERSPCGDVNGDGAVDVADVFFLINFLFAGGQLPPGLANVNQDSTVDVSDVFSLINALFAGGQAPICPGT